MSALCARGGESNFTSRRRHALAHGTARAGRSKALRSDAAMGPASPAAPLVFVGGAAVDWIARVGGFPEPDAKIRTTAPIEVQGGGNAANAATCAGRLGARVALISKVGADSNGNDLVSDLEKNGVDTSAILRQGRTPFTYILVDEASNTRTCIHTPSDAPMRPNELDATKALDTAIYGCLWKDHCSLDEACSPVCVFDGRITENALRVADAARELRDDALLIVEAERLRSHLEELLEKADIIVASKHYPFESTGEEHLGDALISMAFQYPRARAIVVTLGSRGAVALLRGNWATEQETTDERPAANDVAASLDALQSKWQSSSSHEPANLRVPDVACIRWDDAAPLESRYSPNRGDASERDARRTAAAQEEGRRNAGADAPITSSSSQDNCGALPAESLALLACTACAGAKIVDTTGAGDAFIGALSAELASAVGASRSLSLGSTFWSSALRTCSVVAALKCGGVGARSALPRRKEVNAVFRD
ncbi:PfkB family carbohydrate kinase [Pycnococcus provasolii]